MAGGGTRRASLLLALFVSAETSATVRDLATHPPERTVVGVGVPGGALDLDGNGVVDVVTNAAHGVVSGSLLPRGGSIGLLETPLLWAAGRPAVGDLNGDGVLDLALGAEFLGSTPDFMDFAGGAVVLFGPRRVPDRVELDGFVLGGSLPEADWVLIGPPDTDAETSMVGRRIAVGDFTGDGIDDLVVGGISTPWRGGQACVYGIAGPLPRGGVFELGIDTPAFRCCGVPSAGHGVALGDMNGDGRDELALSDFDRVLVFDGTRLVGDVDPGTPDSTILFPLVSRGTADQRSIPVRLADVSGDGLADLLVALNDGEGEVHGVFGRPVLPAVIDLGAGDGDLVVYGGSCCVELGASLGVGDWSADGILDLVLGAPGWDGPSGGRADAGAVHVLEGGAALQGVVDLAVFAPLLTVHGPDAGDRLGDGDATTGVAVADFDGDGLEDLVVGATGALGAANGQPWVYGELHVILAPRSGPSDLLRAVDDPAGLTTSATDIVPPWDAEPGLLDDGLLHFFRLDEARGIESTLSVVPLAASRSVRLSWRDDAATTLVDPTLSDVVTLRPCAAAEALVLSAIEVVVTPRDAAGDRLGAGLDVRPVDPSAWLPGIPTGGFRDLGDGRYSIEAAATVAGSGTVRVEVEGSPLTTSPTITFSDAAAEVVVDATPRRVAMGEVVTLTATITGGAAPLAIEWDADGDGRFLDGRGTTVTVSYARPGGYSVVARVEDASGCVTRGFTRVMVE